MCDIDAPCSKANLDTIKRATATAKMWLPKAQAAMEKYGSTPHAARVRNIAKILKANFGWKGTENDSELSLGGPDVPGNLLRTIKTLRMNIDRPMHAGCGGSVKHAASNPRFAGELRIVKAASLQDGENCFMFMLDFFKPPSSNIVQAKTIIHEMCHAWCGMDDNAYENDAAWSQLNIHNSQSNPDSYACAIRDLGK